MKKEIQAFSEGFWKKIGSYAAIGLIAVVSIYREAIQIILSSLWTKIVETKEAILSTSLVLLLIAVILFVLIKLIQIRSYKKSQLEYKKFLESEEGQESLRKIKQTAKMINDITNNAGRYK